MSYGDYYNRKPEIQVQSTFLSRIGNSCFGCVKGTIGFALFIIACVAASGSMSGVVAGGAVVGVSIPFIIFSFIEAKGYHQEDKKVHRAAAICQVITCVVAIILGSMAIAGAVPASAAGWGYLAPWIISFCLSYTLPCVYPQDSLKAIVRPVQEMIDIISRISPQAAQGMDAQFKSRLRSFGIADGFQ